MGPSSRPLRDVPAQQRWRPTPTPLPPPPPPLPPPPAASAASSGAGDAAAVAAAAANQFDSEKLPQTLVSEIRPFLRVANQIEHESPRVAYLCKSSSLLVPRPAPCVSLVFLFLFFFVPRPPATCSSKCRRRSEGTVNALEHLRLGRGIERFCRFEILPEMMEDSRWFWCHLFRLGNILRYSLAGNDG